MYKLRAKLHRAPIADDSRYAATYARPCFNDADLLPASLQFAASTQTCRTRPNNNGVESKWHAVIDAPDALDAHSANINGLSLDLCPS